MRFVQDSDFNKARAGACLLGLLALPLLAGCGGGSNGNSGGGTTTTTTGTSTGGTNTGIAPILTSSVMTSTGLTASITEASGTVSVNGTLVYTLSLTNNTPNAILAPYTTAGATPIPSVAVKVIGPNGVVSFQPVPGGPPFASESLAPGQSISTTQTASGFTTAGTYTATATFSDGTSAPPVAGPLAVTAQ